MRKLKRLSVWAGVPKPNAGHSQHHADNGPGDPQIGLERTVAGTNLFLPSPEHRKGDDQKGKGQSFEPVTKSHVLQFNAFRSV